MPGPTSRRRPSVPWLAVVLAVAVAAAACSGGGGDGDGPGGEPVVVGFINQERGTVGSFPEVRSDAEAAVRYVNRELDGVGGRPLKLETCATDGTPESSQACANQLRLKNPVAVVGGVDLGAAASIPVLDAAGIPYVGGSPSLGDELTRTNAYMLTGGVAADLLGQAQYAIDTLKPRRVGLIYIDLPGLLSTAVEAARRVLAKKGVGDVTAVPEKADAADFTQSLTAVNRGNPEVIVALFPAQACARIMQARKALAIKARFFFPGACADQAVFDASGGGAEGSYFASGFLSFTDRSSPDVATYLDKRRAHGAGGTPPSVLSQAGFAVIVDLRQLLTEVQGPLSPAAVVAALRASRAHPAFMSHPYTCDRQQVFILSAVCNANVRVLQYRDGALVDVAGGWVNGAELVRLAVG
ncbi:MAG TPA: ABC transporter substrate-binding protein [Acidimicrobiales bacterium]|nr:ABC transporter substrate-binding protein [Acidimicrobiales bacterium]